MVRYFFINSLIFSNIPALSNPQTARQLIPGALLDELVGQAEVEGVPEYLVLVQQVVDRAARAACHGVLFNCDDGVVGLGKFEDKVFVQGLDEAHVGDGGVEFVTDLLRRGDHAAPGEDGGFVAFSDGFALADGECAEVFGYACAWPFAPGVAYGGWAWMVKTGGQHFSTLVFVLGGHDDEVWGCSPGSWWSKLPAWVGPSGPTSPARSRANRTSRFWMATSWMSWS